MLRKRVRLSRRLIGSSSIPVRLISLVALAAILSTMLQVTGIKGVWAAGNYAAAVAADAPAGYWRLDEASGTTAADASGTHTNPLTYQGGYTLGISPGGINGDADPAVTLNGTTGAVTATKAPTAGTTNWSLEAWVSPSTLPQAAVVAYNGQENSNGYGFAIGTSSLTSGSHLIGVVGGVGTFDSGFNFGAPNTWYHVVMTRDTSTIRFYVNGVLQVPTSALVPLAPGARFSLGSAFTTTSAQVYPLAGSVDEGASYNTLLSGGRIQAHFTEGGSATSGYGNWATASPTGPPTARFEPAMGWDAGHSKVVLFGGKNSSGTAIQETWTWDGTTWTKLTPATQPSARWGAKLVYDTALGKMVLFGGKAGTKALNDTWTWNGTTWALVSPTTIPSTRLEYGLSYDVANGVVVLFGGTTGSAALQDTYTFNGTNWTLKAPTAKPSIRSQVAMAYNDAANNTVLFGGVNGTTYNAETWTWDGTNWTQRALSPAPAPSLRANSGLAYNPVTSSEVLVGGVNGSSYFGDAWTWDGTNWSLQSPSTSPTVRAGAGFAYNGVSGNDALFGGLSGATYLNDTLAWNTPPAAPTGISAIAGNAQATISWTAPAIGGSAITGYTLVPYIGSRPGTASNASSSPATITGLTNGTTYTVRVFAKNAVGNGPVATSPAVTPATVPTVPTSVATNPGNQQATLNWQPPASNGGSAVTGYTAQIGTGTCPLVTAQQTQTLGAAVTTATFSTPALINGQQYCAQVFASNAVGSGPGAGATVIPFGAPGAPTGVSVAGTNQQVTINWSAPASNGGAAISGYVAQIWAGSAPSGQALQTLNLGSATVTATFPSLSNGQQYWAQVSATNGVVGPAAGGTGTPSSVPDAPTVTPTPGNGQVSLAWAAVNGQGSSITKYTAKAWQGSNNQGTVVGTQTLSSTATSALFTGLTDGQQYYFEVWATNANGDGSHGSATSTPLGPPAAPSLTPSGGNLSATVIWTAPNNNGAAITGYTASVWLGTDTTQTAISTQSPGASAVSVTFTGLTNGQLYTVGVAAINSQGTGAMAYVQVTPSTTPGASAITATAANQAATANWTAPNNGGSAITGYTAKIWTGTDTTQTPLQTQSLAGTASSGTFSSLVNGQLYTMGVYASNANGPGPLSTVQVTPATVPSAPGAVAATSGNASVNLTWTVPANGGAAITSYQITWSGGSTTVTAPATSATVTGLTNGTSYVFIVAATNLMGTGQSAAANPVVVGTPSAPGSISASGAANEVTVTWTAATANGAAISSYLVVAGGGQAIAVGGSGTSATIKGLPAGSYSFTITASNQFGPGPAGGPASATATGAATTYSGTVRGDGPSAYYRLDDSSGANASDSSGNARQATYVGGISAGATGLLASDSDPGVVLDGSTGYISGPSLAPLTGNSSRSVELWFKTTSTTQQPLLDSGNTGVAGQSFLVGLTQTNGVANAPAQNSPGVIVILGGNDVYLPGLTLTDGAAHHLVVTLLGSTLQIYVDGGTPQGFARTGTSWSTLRSQPFTLGSAPNTTANPAWLGHSRTTIDGNGGTYFSGTVDDAAVYPLALSSALIATHLQASGWVPSAPTNVVANLGTNQVTVNWTSNTAAAAITGTTVTAYNGLQAANSVAVAPAAPSAVLTGLQNGIAYTFKVVQSNAFGTASGTSAAVTPTGAATTYVSAVLGDGPSYYWRLGDSGTTIGSDSSGNNRAGTYRSPTLGQPGALVGDASTSANFTSSSIISRSAGDGLPTGNAARSLEVWFESTNTNTQELVGYGPAYGSPFVLRLTGSTIQAFYWSAGPSVVAPYNIENGAWHHVVVTYDGTSINFYLDGQHIGNPAAAGPLTTTSDVGLMAGAEPWDGGNDPFRGNLQEVAVYPTTLSAAQVLSHFNSSGNSRPTAPTNVIAVGGANQATVSWAASTASAGSPVTGYTVNAFDGLGRAAGSVAVSSTATTTTVNSLAAGSGFTFTVVATNNFGQSVAGSTAAAVTVSPPAASTYASTVLADSPSYYWRLGDSGTTIGSDSSGNNRAGTYRSPTLGQPGALVGDASTSANFTSSSIISRSAGDGLPTGNAARSLEVWFESTNTNTQELVGYGPAYGSPFVLRLTGSTIQAFYWSAGPSVVAPYNIENGAWHHVVVTYDGTSINFYLDGQHIGNPAAAGPLTTTSDVGLMAGAEPWDGANDPFRGNLQEVAVYPATLSAAQVLSHFNSSGNSRPTAPTNVMAVGGANQATVSWAASTASAGSPVTGYTVNAFDGLGRAAGSVAVSSTATTTTVNSLAAGSGFTFTVVATNNFGQSVAGSTAAAVPVSPPAASTYASTVLADSPSYYWRLGDSGTTIGSDSSGNNRIGSYRSVTLGQPGALVGDASTSASFTSSSIISRSAGDGLPTGNAARSLEVWFESTNTNTQELVGYGPAYGSPFVLRLTGSTIQAFYWSAGPSVVAPYNIENGAWHHVVVTYDGTSINFYLDGQHIGNPAAAGPLTTTSDVGLMAGAEPWDGANDPFRGNLQEVAVYPTALTGSQVINHFNAGGSTLTATPSNVVVTPAPNQLAVTWSGGTALGGHYEVSALTASQPSYSVAVAATSRAATMTGLAAGQYSVRVTAVNPYTTNQSATSGAVTVTGTATTYASTALADAPSVYYRMTDPNGNYAADSSGNGRTAGYLGAAHQPATPGAILGDPDPGLQVGGSSVLQYASGAGLPVGNSARTMEVWLKTSSVNASGVVGYGNQQSNAAFTLDLQSATQVRLHTWGTDPTFTLPRSVTDNNWHYLAVTFDGATAALYLDGVLVSSQAVTLTTAINTNGFAVGEGAVEWGTFFPGSVDEAAVYPTALSAARIASHWQSAGYAPGAPTAVSAVAGVNQATVSWSPPAYLGSPALSAYSIVATAEGSPVATKTTDAGSTSLNFASLPGSHTYTFQVTAQNTRGPGPVSTPSPAVTVQSPPPGPGLGQNLFLRESGSTQRGNYNDGFVSRSNVPAMTHWTVEGFIWGFQQTNAILTTNMAWGLLGGTTNAPSPAAPIAGINFNIGALGGPCCNTTFTYPGGGDPIVIDPNGLPPAFKTSTPTHVALTYDSITVRGFVNGVLIGSRVTSSAATPPAPAGFYDQVALASGYFDEFRVSNSARYVTDFPPPTTALSSDALLLYDFNEYQISKLPSFQATASQDLQPYTSIVRAAAFADQSGHGNHANVLVAFNHCCTPSDTNTLTYTPYILGPGVTADEVAGGGSPWECSCHFPEGHYPIDTATGEFWHSFQDISIPNRGPAINLARTYSSHNASTISRFGFGWADSYNESLTVNGNVVTVHAGNGSTVTFTNNAGVYSAPPQVLASLVLNGGIYTFTDKGKNQYTFNVSGQLTGVADSNNEASTLAYTTFNGSSVLSTVTDPSGSRSLTFFYLLINGHILVDHVVDSSRTVTYGYDPATEDLLQVTDIGGGITKFTYDSSHQLLTMRDPNCTAAGAACNGGNGVANVYTSGQVTQQTDYMGRVTRYDYTSIPFTTKVTDPKGFITLYEYVGSFLLSTTREDQTGTVLAVTTYGYDPNTIGATTVTDPDGDTITTTRDGQANLLSATDALGRTTTYAGYNAFNEPQTVTDAAGTATTNTYDPNGNLTQVSTPLVGSGQNRVIIYTHGNALHPGDVTQMTDPDGKVWTYAYDTSGNRSSVTDPLTDKTTYVFDSLSRLTSMVTPKGNVSGGTPSVYTTTYSPNPWGQPLTVTDPLLHQTSNVYDGDQNLTSSTDANQHQTIYKYDLESELTEVDRADASTVKTGYDANGNVQTQTDGLTHQVTYGYDPLNRKTSTTDALNRVTSYSYDAAGNLTSLLDPLNQTTSYRYDVGNQLLGVTYSDGRTPNVSYSYDALGRRLGMQDGTGSSSYSYDSLGRLTQSTNGAAAQLKYGYDLKGQLTSLVYPGGVNTVTRTYDDAGRLNTVQDWLAHTTAFKFDPNSNLFEQDYPNSTIASLTYNAADQLSGITDGLSGVNFLNFSYGRDNLGQLTSDGAKSYSNDTINRLLTATSGATTTYGYDNADRLTTKSISGGGNTSTLAYDNADQLQSLTVTNGVTQISKTTYGFDAKGSRTSASIQGGSTTTLGYDQANRLISYGASATYAYNGDGLRTSKTVSGTAEAFTWDVAQGLPLIVQDGTTSYMTGPGGLPLEQITGATVHYYHSDQLGSVRALTDAAGTVQQTYDYDPWGNVIATWGGIANPFTFDGQYTDQESTFIYLRARYYDSGTGQFTSTDPAVCSTRQAYAYAVDGPLNGADPTGLNFWGNLQNGIIGGYKSAHQWATQNHQRLEAEGNAFDNVSTLAGVVEGTCAGLAGLAALGVVTLPADLPLAGCVAASSEIGMQSLAVATLAHGGACWGGAGQEACDNAKVDAFLLPTGYAGGKAGERLGERFAPGLRPAIIGVCDAATSTVADLWKKIVTGG